MQCYQGDPLSLKASGAPEASVRKKEVTKTSVYQV